MTEPTRPLISAHRGGRAEAPENTLAAFEYAAGIGTPGAECDIHLSADGVPVVIHDPTVDRTTDGTGEVADLTAAELAGLDARSVHTAWPERTGVPAFADLMTLAAAFDYLEVEIKADDPARIEVLVPLLIEEIDAAGAREKVRFISFDTDIVALCHELAPDMMLSYLTHGATDSEIQKALDLGCDGIAGDVQSATQAFVDAAHAAGLAFTCWTVNEDEDFDNVLAWGVDVITTDRPKHFLARLEAARAAA